MHSFTEVEQAAHQNDHALIGALMALSWGVSQTVCLAIRPHHDYAVFQDPKVPDAVAQLIAMGLVADLAIQTYDGLNASNEWSKGGTKGLGALILNDQDLDEWGERLIGGFSDGVAFGDSALRRGGAVLNPPSGARWRTCASRGWPRCARPESSSSARCGTPARGAASAR